MIVIECASNERHQSQTVAHSTTGEEVLSKMKIYFTTQRNRQAS